LQRSPQHTIASTLAIDGIASTTDRYRRLVAMLEGDGLVDACVKEFLPTPFGLDRCVASSLQRQLWFLEQLAPRTSAYHVPLAVRFTGSLNVAALESALNVVVVKHEVLRTVFAEDVGEPVQVIHPPTPRILETVDIDIDGDGDIASGYRETASAMMRSPIDLTDGPLWRVALLRATPQDHCLCFVFHHAVIDGWSLDLLLRDLAAAYAQSASAVAATNADRATSHR
jgi:hypothetical protein